MTAHPLDPQVEYEALAEALQAFQAQEAEPTSQTIPALQEAVARATDVWQQCEPLRAPREKEFRYHVVKLKMLLAGAYQTRAATAGFPLSQAA
jgi:hypothetical protein